MSALRIANNNDSLVSEEEQELPRCCFLPELVKNPGHVSSFDTDVDPETIIALVRYMKKLAAGGKRWYIEAGFAKNEGKHLGFICGASFDAQYKSRINLSAGAAGVNEAHIKAVLVVAFCAGNANAMDQHTSDESGNAAIMNVAVRMYKPTNSLDLEHRMSFVQWFSISQVTCTHVGESNFSATVDASFCRPCTTCSSSAPPSSQATSLLRAARLCSRTSSATTSVSISTSLRRITRYRPTKRTRRSSLSRRRSDTAERRALCIAKALLLVSLPPPLPLSTPPPPLTENCREFVLFQL